jgi:chromosome segregation ATPase
VAENPFQSLVRILGGVVLLQGKLGHQVLGQMLIADSSEVTIAAASLVIAATAREKNAVGQALIRTLAPAIAVHALLQREEKRLQSIREDFERRVRELERSQRNVEVRNAEVASLHAKVKSHKADVDTQEGRVTAQEAVLLMREDALDAGKWKLTRDLNAHESTRREHENRLSTLEQERDALGGELSHCRTQLDAKASELDGIAAKNVQLTRQLKELSARLRQKAKRPATKTAAKRPRTRKKKS